jgi:hypothetical protein
MGVEFFLPDFSSNFTPCAIQPVKNPVQFPRLRSLFPVLLVPGIHICGGTTGKKSSRDWDIGADPESSFDLKPEYRADNEFNITLQIPVQGTGDCCTYGRTVEIDDSGLRARAGDENRIVLDHGISIRISYTDGYAFRIGLPRPPRICLRTGEAVSEYHVLKKNGIIDIDGVAASLYGLPLDPSRELKELRLETLSNDVVMGLMDVTLVQSQR